MNADNTEVTCISLCSGYEGIGMGIKRVIPNLRVILYSEIELFACENLADKMEQGLIEPAPIWTDLKTLPCEQFSGKVDILTGGYPCQPFSAAGQRKGAEDPRHLWPSIRRAIKSIRPAMCFFENVEGHISLGLSTVISDLEEDGYRTTCGIFSAAEVGAPHQRKRVFIMAVNNGSSGWPIQTGYEKPKRETQWESSCDCGTDAMAVSESAGNERITGKIRQAQCRPGQSLPRDFDESGAELADSDRQRINRGRRPGTGRRAEFADAGGAGERPTANL